MQGQIKSALYSFPRKSSPQNYKEIIMKMYRCKIGIMQSQIKSS